jgi:hypothetical protein
MVLSVRESTIDPLAFRDSRPVEHVAGWNFPLEIGESSFIIRVDGETIFSPSSGCSSVVERHVANVAVVGSSPITRSVNP